VVKLAGSISDSEFNNPKRRNTGKSFSTDSRY